MITSHLKLKSPDMSFKVHDRNKLATRFPLDFCLSTVNTL